ncbi:creatininase family protein [Frigoribacterium sp. VKM Ac-2836]|uniref:creatininase family protein n=1 Tax=Frigoribacterium sp. VKM Ac-2836 TaxID=2739014 RepID=UPI001563B460|nr:creatininase family protein [Frigoribacterium sp. VKM Ac-2836]NRD27713.1 creatininase family protein [Frigoribacterium sp. VKM Ac-2836]
MIDADRTPWPDVAAAFDRGAGIAVLPFGAFEQHGPHLPLGTDTATALEVARRLADRLDAVLLPPVHYGDTWNTAGYRGTLSLSSATVTAIVVDLGRALAASGAGGLVVVNGDWGNRAPLYAATRQLIDHGVLRTVTLDHPGMAEAIEQVRESAPAAPGLAHAEEIETSIMLRISPEDVRRDRYEASYPVFPSDFGTTPMQLHPFSPSGVFGDPSTATADKGERLLDATVEGAMAVLGDFVTAIEDDRAASAGRRHDGVGR